MHFQVALVLAVRSGSSGLQAAQALLELFRAAQELPSAEYLIMDERSSDGMGRADVTGMLQQTVADVQSMFGVRARYLQAEEGAASYTGDFTRECFLGIDLGSC
jgi:hypothetical protein